MGSCLMMVTRVILVTLTLALGIGSAVDPKTKYEKIDFQTSVEQGYEKRARPKEGEAPLNVLLSGYVLDVIPVKLSNRYFATVSMYFRQSWRDDRIFVDRSESGHKGLFLRELGNLWHPDTFFRNEIKMQANNIIEQFVRIDKDEVLWSQRLQKQFPCEKDTETNNLRCEMRIESFGYRLEDIRFLLAHGATRSFIGYEFIPGFLGVDAKVAETSLSIGNYTDVSVTINMEDQI